MSYHRKLCVEVEITGRVQSREEFERQCFVSHISDNNLPYRGIVDHPNGRMEWQWCNSLAEAKSWVDSTIDAYARAALAKLKGVQP